MSKIVPWNFFQLKHFIETYHELHVIPSFAVITVREQVVDLVFEVLLLERDEVLLAEIQEFHLILVFFFGHNKPGIRVS